MFLPRIPAHRERIDWASVTHVRLRPDAKADTNAGARVLQHIRRLASADGVAAIDTLGPDFPTVRSHPTPLQAMRADLRHMANLRDAGEREENKGLIELGMLMMSWL